MKTFNNHYMITTHIQYTHCMAELMLLCFVIHYIDGHESKPAISILAIVQESRKTSAFG